ncbi:MAG TPA: PaaX family transcriptional regulator C-terminal domain-containing protein [Nocardioidaceae bacterium]|nr:PaaX family transcriptional regulator C-terminal domain-containing protein [Nocardioidaceae bacterium]
MTEPGTDIPPRQLITSLYGLYARAEHDWLSVAALVRLMEDLGVDAAAVRSSVSRLKKRDVLRSMKREGRAGYALSPDTLAILREGDVRIFSRPRATPEDGWLVVVFSVPESERERRHALRAQLVRLGLGTAAPGVWMAPGTLFDEVALVLERTELMSYTEFFRSEYLGPGDVTEKLPEWWDLDELEALYTDFHATYAPVRKRLAGTAPSADVAFRLYVPMLTAWRRLPYRDPGLPLEYLPSGWKGVTAGQLFADLDDLLRGPADEHAQQVLHAGGGTE